MYEMEDNEKQEPIVEQTEQEALENTADVAEPMDREAPENASFDTEDELDMFKKKNSELKDKYLRLFAEFDNYKKRTVKEKIDLMQTAAQDTMTAILPVLDDFDRAKKIAEDENTEETLSEGIRLVYNKLYATLRQKGLQPMESTGQPFDPELHEAVTEIPAPSEEMKGKVVDTIEKGYMLKDKIIRHAKVVVGK